jgi:hypothetical protein
VRKVPDCRPLQVARQDRGSLMAHPVLAERRCID